MQFPNRSEIFDPSEWEPSSLEEQEAGLPPYTWVEIKINRRDIQECYGYREKSVGFVIDILTKSETHPYGIMVQIQTGEEGRVQRLLSKEEIEEIDEESRKQQIKNLGGVIPDEPSTDEETPDEEWKETFNFDTKEHKFREEGKIEAANSRKKDEKNIKTSIRKEVSIAVSAFSNTSGGILEIGKTDDGKISDYFQRDLTQYTNWDEYTRKIIEFIGVSTHDNVFADSIQILNSPGQKDYLRLKIRKGKNPVFIHDKNTEEFYIRSKAAAKSQKLTASETHRYLKEHFPNY